MRTAFMILILFAVVGAGIFLLLGAGGGVIAPEQHIGGPLPK